MFRKFIKLIYPPITELEFYKRTVTFLMINLSGELLPPKYADWYTYVKYCNRNDMYFKYPFKSEKDIKEVISYVYSQYLRTKLRIEFQELLYMWWDRYGTKRPINSRIKPPKDTIYTYILKWIYR